MFKRILLPSLLIVSVLMSALAPFIPAYAASEFDGFIVNGGSMSISTAHNDWNGLPISCSADLSTTWQSVVSDSSSWNSNVSASATSFITALDYAISNPGTNGWAVSQVQLTNDPLVDGLVSYGSSYGMISGDSLLKVYVSSSFNASFHSDSSGAGLVADGNYQVAYISFSNSSCAPRVVQYSSGTSGDSSYGSGFMAMVPNSQVAVLKPVFVNFNVTYPDGYDGLMFSGSVDPSSDVIRPDITYSLSKYDIAASDISKDLPDATIDDGVWNFDAYYVQWSLFKCGAYDAVSRTCLDPHQIDAQVDSQILPLGSQYAYKVKDKSYYELEATYLVHKCRIDTTYDDSCPYVAPDTLDSLKTQYNFTSVSVFLNVDGSSVVAGSTSDQDCDASGVCAEPSIYTDCSTFGTDIVGALNCVVSNVQVWFVSLWVPTTSQFQSLQLRVRVWAADHARAFVQIGDWFSDQFWPAWSSSQAIVCNHDFGQFFGHDFTLNQCVVEQQFPQVWGVITLVIRATVAFALIFMVIAKIRYVIGLDLRGVSGV